MDWQKGNRSGVEDRRGGPSGPQMAGGGIVTILIALAAYYFFGVDPSTVMNAIDQTNSAPQTTQSQTTPSLPDDEFGAFSDTIHTSANEIWNDRFRANQLTFKPSRLVLYTQGTSTGCGYGKAAMGPFYCPADQTVYLDDGFFTLLSDKLGANGDFAAAYVIAHEVGHHVQFLSGTTDKVQKAQARLSKADGNRLSVALELQADCYAGIWAKRSHSKYNWLDQGDLAEAMAAAAAVGDDKLQREATGQVQPESFTHGTSAQRQDWFRRGYESGEPQQCDPFYSL